jgi:hypothetical protein
MISAGVISARQDWYTTLTLVHQAYVTNLGTKQCKIYTITRPWHGLDIPNNATFEGFETLGAYPDFVTLSQWIITNATVRLAVQMHLQEGLYRGSCGYFHFLTFRCSRRRAPAVTPAPATRPSPASPAPPSAVSTHPVFLATLSCARARVYVAGDARRTHTFCSGLLQQLHWLHL